MRILHLWDTYVPGLFDQSLELSRAAGLDVRLIAMNLGVRDPLPSDVGVEAVRRYRYRSARHNLANRLIARLRRELDQRRFRALVERTLKRLDPDAVHIHFGTTAAALGRVIDRLPPTVVSFYGYDISQGIRDPSVAGAYRRLIGRGALLHVLCDEAAQRLIALGADGDHIVNANLPLPLARYPALPQRDPVRRWLLPARFVEKKGHKVALDALAIHRKSFPEATLTCWGYGDEQWLCDHIASHPERDAIAVVNNAGEGPFDAAYVARLRDHDAILAPSIQSAAGDDEGGPALTCVLAQAAAKPVIMSNFPGHERSLTDGVEGLVVAQGDAAALAAAMNRMADNAAESFRMGQAGRDRAHADFTADAYRDHILGWYRRLLR